MRSVNRVVLLGNLGGDPELKTTPAGVSVATFSLATNESWTDKNSGEKQEKVEWHRIVVWRKLAEVCNEHLQKGSKVYLEGKLQTRTWDDNNGQKHYMTEVIAHDIVFLDRAGEGGGGWIPKDEEAPPVTYQEEKCADDLPF